MKSLLTLCLVLAIQLVRAQTPVSPSAGASTAAVAMSADERAVSAVEKQRFDAQVSKNYAVLEQVLANDLIYAHSSGATDSKQSYIQSIRDGKSNYAAIDVQEQKVRVYGNTAIINGVCLIKMNNNNMPTEMKLRYTDVYVKNGKQWQMAAWQSLRLTQ